MLSNFWDLLRMGLVTIAESSQNAHSQQVLSVASWEKAKLCGETLHKRLVERFSSSLASILKAKCHICE